MTPRETMGQLINIVSRLANSRSPDPKLVKLALQRVIADIDVPASPPGATAQMEQQAFPQSQPGKQNVLHMIKELERAFLKLDEDKFKSILDKLSKSADAGSGPTSA